MDMLKNTGPIDLNTRADLRPHIENYASDNDMTFDDALDRISTLYVQAAHSVHGSQYDFRATLNDVGQIKLLQVLTVVSTVTDEDRQVSLTNARKTYPNIELGGYILNQITPVEPEGLFDTPATQTITVKGMTLKPVRG